MTRDTIIHCAATVYVLSCTAFILFVLLRYCGLPGTVPSPTQATEDVPFEEFYLDLHTYAVDADFSRSEAVSLYGVWQRQREEVTS